MVKILGSICVLGGGALAWWIQMSERQRKRDTLSELVMVLRRMQEEIRMTRTPLPLLLETLSADCRESQVVHMLRQVAEAARQGEELGKVWRQAVANLPLEPRDREVLDRVDLHGDEENVCKGISLVIYELAKSAEDLEKRRPEEARRTSALCFSAAALLVILLI